MKKVFFASEVCFILEQIYEELLNIEKTHSARAISVLASENTDFAAILQVDGILSKITHQINSIKDDFSEAKEYEGLINRIKRIIRDY